MYIKGFSHVSHLLITLCKSSYEYLFCCSALHHGTFFSLLFFCLYNFCLNIFCLTVQFLNITDIQIFMLRKLEPGGSAAAWLRPVVQVSTVKYLLSWVFPSTFLTSWKVDYFIHYYHITDPYLISCSWVLHESQEIMVCQLFLKEQSIIIFISGGF